MIKKNRDDDGQQQQQHVLLAQQQLAHEMADRLYVIKKRLVRFEANREYFLFPRQFGRLVRVRRLYPRLLQIMTRPNRRRHHHRNGCVGYCHWPPVGLVAWSLTTIPSMRQYSIGGVILPVI
jgi:hypothetical protein